MSLKQAVIYAKFNPPMKALLRTLLINTVAFWSLSNFTPLITIESWESLLLVSLALTLANLLAKPVLKLITLPLNLLTLGLFSGVLTLIILYLVIRVVPGVYVSGFRIPGFSRSGFTAPTIQFSRLTTLGILAIGISIVQKTAGWLLK